MGACIPPGLSLAENKVGWQMSMPKLARLVERVPDPDGEEFGMAAGCRRFDGLTWQR